MVPLEYGFQESRWTLFSYRLSSKYRDNQHREWVVANIENDIKMAFSDQLKCHDFCNYVFDENGKAKGKGVGANWLRKQPGRYGKVAKTYFDRLTKEECEKERKEAKPDLEKATKRAKKHFEKQVGKTL